MNKMNKTFISILAIVIILSGTFAIQESFAVEQKYIDLMNSYYKNVSDQILDTEGIAISNYVEYINQTIN